MSSYMRVDMSRRLAHFTYVGDASIAAIPIMPPLYLGALLHMIAFPSLLPQPNRTGACAMLYILPQAGLWPVPRHM